MWVVFGVLLAACSSSKTAVDAQLPGDRDGDGIDDAADRCPDIADPALRDQRDHDADGFGDPCDGCPHLNTQTNADQDSDGVGDACDPRPTMAGESRVLWIGFYDDDAATVESWPRTGTWSMTGGSLRNAKSNQFDTI